MGDAVAAADGRGEPGPGRQLARRAEPAHVTDLGQDDQRGERADARQLGEHLDPRVGPGALADLPVQPVNPLLQRVDQPQVIPGQLAGDRQQVQGGEPGPSRAGPVPAGRPVVPVAGHDGMDPVAQPGPQPHQIDPVPQQRPQLPHRRRGNPGFWQQVRPQQLSQDRGVDLVVLQPRRGDRLAPRRVHQVRGEPIVLQHRHQPPRAERRLQRGRRARRQAADHLQDRLCPVGHIAVGEHLATGVDDRHLRALAVHVDPDVNRHDRASFPSSTVTRKLSSPG